MSDCYRIAHDALIPWTVKLCYEKQYEFRLRLHARGRVCQLRGETVGVSGVGAVHDVR